MVENDSTWTVYELGLPKVYAIIPTIFTVMIIVNNILVMVTLSKVNRKSFQDIFIMALAAADLVTSLTMTVASGTFMTGYAVITDKICALYAVSTVACVSTTTWLHSVICIEKCQTICGKAYSTSFNENYIGHFIYFSHGIFLGACNLGCDQANLHTSCGRLLNCDRLEVRSQHLHPVFCYTADH